MNLDAFNIVAGIITVAAFVFSMYIYIKDKSILRAIESGLIGLIGSLDLLAATANHSKYSKKEISLQAIVCRNHAISILKTFSSKEERYNTFDFGLKAGDIHKRIQERKEKLGMDIGGRSGGQDCIVHGQDVMTKDGVLPVDAIHVGLEVASYDLDTAKLCSTVIQSCRKATTKNFIRINDELELTAVNTIFLRDRGWVMASELTIGDEIMTIEKNWKMIRSLEYVPKETTVFSVKTNEPHNLFVTGYLVHNK